MSSNAPPRLFDRQRLRYRRKRLVDQFSEYDFLKARLSNDLRERLADISHEFVDCLDLGSHTGAFAKALGASEPAKHIIAADLCEAMVRQTAQMGAFPVVLDEEALAFADASFDLVVSGLSLHWVNDLPGSLVQIRRCLRPDGLFLGALFGAGTLSELRASLMEAETDIRGGASPRIAPLPGLQDMAGLLQRAGFALPVVDIDPITVRYDSALHLMRDLGGMGERAAFTKSMGGLSRRILARSAEIYARDHSDHDGRVRATFKVIWVSGWAPAPDQPKPLKPGSAKVRLADALGVKEIKT